MTGFEIGVISIIAMLLLIWVGMHVPVVLALCCSGAATASAEPSRELQTSSVSAVSSRTMCVHNAGDVAGIPSVLQC